MTEGEYISIADAMKAADLTRATLYRLLVQQQIETYKFPGKRQTYILRADLDKLRGPMISKARQPKST